MRNRYPGICYRCGLLVEKQAGHFERHKGSWRVQHAQCAINHRQQKVSNNGQDSHKINNSSTTHILQSS